MKKIKYLLASFAFVFTLQSCDSLLDQDDPNKVTEAVVVKSLDGLESINRGFYRALPLQLNFYNQSLITDELVFPSVQKQNLGGGIGQYVWSYGPGTVTERDDITGVYLGLYTVVRRTNITINNISAIVPINEKEDILKKTLTAEAYAMRALAHYYVLRNFSAKYNPTGLGCAYVTENAELNLPSRLTMEQSYSKVLEDLSTALQMFPNTLPANYGGAYRNNRLTKGAVYALQAKVNLEIGKYDDAINAANEALKGKSLTAANSYINVWSDSNDGQEVIFKQSNIQGAGTNPGQLFYNTSNQVQWNASATLMNKYEDTDVRKTDLFVTIKDLGFVPGKYLLPNIKGVKPVRGLADIKLLRLADVLLVRSEAYARKGDLNNAFTDYKLLRDTRNAGVSTAFSTSDDALNQIFDERARELAFEGERLVDMKRFGKTIKRIAEDSRPGYTDLIFTDVDKFTLPIPLHEILANKNMVQNPGWSN